jgi:hypothetical protein
MKEQVKEVLEEALMNVMQSLQTLTHPTYPNVSLPRPPKPIALGQDIYLDLRIKDGQYKLLLVCCGVVITQILRSGNAEYPIPAKAREMAEFIMPHVDRPRDIVRVVRRLQWLATWARKRMDGRRRAAEEILRQQRKWVDIIENEIAINKLAQ